MVKTIKTFEVAITRNSTGAVLLDEINKVHLPELDQTVTIEKPADITKVAVELSQENTRVKEVAEAFVPVSGKSTIKMKYLM